MKQQKIEQATNMNINNFDSWIEYQNKKGWFITQIHKWETYPSSDRLDFILLLEKDENDESNNDEH